jgi:hypothetical protein
LTEALNSPAPGGISLAERTDSFDVPRPIPMPFMIRRATFSGVFFCHVYSAYTP